MPRTGPSRTSTAIRAECAEQLDARADVAAVFTAPTVRLRTDRIATRAGHTGSLVPLAERAGRGLRARREWARRCRSARWPNSCPTTMQAPGTDPSNRRTSSWQCGVLAEVDAVCGDCRARHLGRAGRSSTAPPRDEMRAAVLGLAVLTALPGRRPDSPVAGSASLLDLWQAACDQFPDRCGAGVRCGRRRAARGATCSFGATRSFQVSAHRKVLLTGASLSTGEAWKVSSR